MGEAAAKESSMEDILASIRKIISQDDKPEKPEPAAAGKEESDRRWYDEMPAGQPEAPQVAGTRPSASPQPDAVTAPRRTGIGVHRDMPPSTLRPSSTLTPPNSDDRQGSLANLASRIKSASVPPTAQVRDASSAPSQPAPAKAQPYAGQYPGKPESFAGTSPQRPSASSAPAASKPAAIAGAGFAQPQRVTENPGPAPARDRQERDFREALVSPSTQTAVQGSIDRLKSSLLDDTDAKVEAVLRPMLREWLDENLPKLVEKLVRDEVERIAKGK